MYRITVPLAALAAVLLLLLAVLVATPAAADQASFGAAHDAYVEQAAPDTNSGGSNQLRHDGSPLIESYLQFDVTGIPAGATIDAATLTLTPGSNNNAGLELHEASGAIDETTLTYNTAPGFDPTVLDTSGPVTSGTAVDLDVTNIVAGDGTYTFHFDDAGSNTNTKYWSKENGTGQPALTVEYTPGGGSSEPPGSEPPPGPTEADLSVTKSGNAGDVEEGQQVTWTLTVDNAGPGDATGVTVTDDLPTGYSYDSSAPSQGSCSEASGTVTCDLGALANGAQATVDITATAKAVTNTATVAGAETDPNAGNDNASDGVGITPTPPVEPGATKIAVTGDFGGQDDRGGTVINDIAARGDIEALFIGGDQSYSEIVPESAWCDWMLNGNTNVTGLGQGFPLQLVAGNHEEDSQVDGYILNFRDCAPDQLGSDLGPGGYAVSYASDLGPLTMVSISPDLTVGGVSYDYTAGSQKAWLDGAIADAQAEGDFVVVLHHKNCITMGNKSCEVGEAFHDQLIASGVDLVVMGHDHDYQRTHQLSDVVENGGGGANVVDTDGDFAKDAGTVFLITGTTGRSLTTCDHNDTEAANFAAHWCGEESTSTHGYSLLTVAGGVLTHEYVTTDPPQAPADVFTIR